MLFLMHAYGARMWNDQARWPHDHVYQIPALTESLLYMDAPWWMQWPCFVPWLITQPLLSVAWLRNAFSRTFPPSSWRSAVYGLILALCKPSTSVALQILSVEPYAKFVP